MRSSPSPPLLYPRTFFQRSASFLAICAARLYIYPAIAVSVWLVRASTTAFGARELALFFFLRALDTVRYSPAVIPLDCSPARALPLSLSISVSPPLSPPAAGEAGACT